MHEKPLALLIVDDESAPIEAVGRAFEAAGTRVHIRSAGTLREFRACVRDNPPDLALIELNLPDGRALEALQHPPEAAPFPILVMTALGDQQLATEVLKAGALDCVTKSPAAFAAMPRIVERALREWAQLRKRELSEAALRQSEGNFRALFEALTDMIMVGTRDGQTLYTNAAVSRTLGYTPDELRDMNLLALHPAGKRAEAEAIFAAMFRGERETCPLPLERKDGSLVPAETRVWFGRWNGEECVFGISKDLRAEQEAQQRFERLFRHNPALMALNSQADRRFVDVNDAFVKTLGYSRAGILGKTAAELGLFPQAERQSALAALLEKDGRFADFELQVRRQDGEILDGLFSGDLISSQGRQYFLTVMIDISARKRIEQEVLEQKSLLNTIIESTSAAVFAKDLAGRYRLINKAGAQMLGCTPAEVVGRTDAELLPAETAGAFKEGDADVLSSGRDLEREETGTLDGRRHVFLAHKSPWRNPSGGTIGIVGVSSDITERKHVDEAVLEAGHRERMEVGRLLHDTLGQELAGLSFLAKALEHTLARTGHPESASAAHISALLQGTVRETRQLVRGLLPVELLEDGFRTAVRELCDFAKQTYGVACTCTGARSWRIRDQKMATHLYYIASEALTNGVRHGKATRVRIGLTTAKGVGCLTVADNGGGLPPEALQSPGRGLRIMRDRAQLIGGALRIEPNRPCGTRVICTFPNAR